MKHKLNQNLVKKVQKIFWIYLTNNFVISDINDFKKVEAKIQCEFVPIALNNYQCVENFREQGRISEYRDKLTHEEIGFFAQHKGKMIGSIWAGLLPRADLMSTKK